ncbi:hypothetical protein [Mycobacterium uberis]|uniref:hypothetical protein n=1 Tax=Mycobacterium uberis TaxID=2162698 RepID=UPI0014020AFE|nr:hypothetical protein [Mycobacterium uberis]
MSSRADAALLRCSLSEIVPSRRTIAVHDMRLEDRVDQYRFQAVALPSGRVLDVP